MKPLVIYHASCADGFAAAFAAWLKLGDEAEYVPMQYGKIDFDFEGGFFNLGSHEADNPCTFIAGRDVYILDFSFPKELMDYIFANAKRVVWLDHHKSAFEMWCDEERTYTKHEDKYHTIILDNNKSGAMLAWEYFHPDTEVPMFIRHIDDYDRWQFKIPCTKEFNKAIWSHAPWSFEQWQHEWDSTWGYSSADGLEGMPNFIREGEAILRAHDQNVQAVVKNATRKCEITLPRTVLISPDTLAIDVSGLAANCPPHLQSDVGHELANQSGTFGLLWCIDKNNVCRCSLRSNGDYDVSAIAKAFGGGGHRNAAGFTTDIQTLLEWTK